VRSSPGTRRRSLAAALVALVLPAACGERIDPQVGLDLAALLPEAESWSETTLLDLGSHAAKAALVAGWAAPSRGEFDYLWGLGERSALDFRRADARAFRIRLRGWSHPRLPQGAEVETALNGTPLGRLWLGPAPETVELAVPAGAARPGINRLTLVYPVVVPSGRERRPLGVAWDILRFEGRRSGEVAAGAGSTAGSLELPAGTGIDWFLELAAPAELRLDGVETHGGARLQADLACAGEASRFALLRDSPRARRRTAALRRGESNPRLCRLTLRAEPPEKGVADAGVRLAAVRLLGAAAAELETSGDASAALPAPPPPQGFVVYLVDTLRADRLAAYGERRGLTPSIDAFARQSVVFASARAQSSWTRPTVATIFTGLAPLRHGANDVGSRLPEEVETLAERLRAAGFRTGYVTANGNTTATFGFAQGFEFFRRVGGDSELATGEWREVHAAGREFLDLVTPGERFLLVLHTVEPHAPYRPSAAQRARWAPDADLRLGDRAVLVGLPGRRLGPDSEIARQVSALYDAEVADADEGFADLLAELDRRERRGGTSILLLSDHGEELLDHGRVEHGQTLYEEQLRVPMIWQLPGAGAGRIETPVDQVDILPTLLAVAGLAEDRSLAGRSFAAALRGGTPPAARASAAWLGRLTFRQEAVVEDGFKLIRDLNPRALASAATEQLFALSDDPRESAPIEPLDELRRGFLRARLRGWAARSGPPLAAGEAARIDDALRRELAALGYLD